MFRYQYFGNGVFPVQVNQAIEGFLLRGIGSKKESSRIAAVRFSSFPHDSIVLGYGQSPDVLKGRDPAVDYARRITGGAHIQVGSNVVTYTFVAPRDGSFRTYEDMRAYYAEHIANALTNIGVNNVTTDNKASVIKVNGRVIAGHAMFWGVRSALLHGIITLTPYDVDRIASRVVLQQREIGGEIYTEYSALRNLPSVATELNGSKHFDVRPNILREVVGDAILKEVTGGDYERKEIDNMIIAQSLELLKQRYSTSRWMEKHKPTFTKEEAEEIPGEELDGPLRKNLPYCLFLQVPDEDFKKMAQPTDV